MPVTRIVFAPETVRNRASSVALGREVFVLAGQQTRNVSVKGEQQLTAHVDVAVVHRRDVFEVVGRDQLAVGERQSLQSALHVGRVPCHHDVAQECQ